MMIMPPFGSASKDLRSRSRSCSWFQSCMIIEYTCTSWPGGSGVGEEVAAVHGDAIAQFGVGDLVGCDVDHVGQIEDGRGQRRVAPAELDGERAGAATDVEQSRRGVEIDRVCRACVR